MSGYIYIFYIYCIILSEDLFTYTNSVAPDEMRFIWVYVYKILVKGFPVYEGLKYLGLGKREMKYTQST